MNTNSSDQNPKNRDPITGAPGSHPVGTGVGAVAGGAAGAAAAGAAAGAGMGAVGGPIGMAAGVAIGAIAGGFAGKGVAEKVNPTKEDAYWRENHDQQSYAAGRPYSDYQDAYRMGYEGYSRYGTEGRGFDDFESDFRQDYSSRAGTSGLKWDEAKNAARAAWDRVAGRTHQQLIGYEVQDSQGSSVGKVHNLWTDETGQPFFLGVKTGWFFGKNHVVPVKDAQVNETRKVVRLPYTEDQIKEAPSFDETSDITDTDQNSIFSYYGIKRGSASLEPQSRREERMESPSSRVGDSSASDTTEDRTLQLKEEQVRVGKRQVEAGGVRLRKVVRTETVNEPVELQREEIVIERKPASGATVSGEARFEEEDIFIPLRREEAVIQKDTRVREEVRVGKKTEVDQQQVTAQVRKEDLQVDRNTPSR